MAAMTFSNIELHVLLVLADGPRHGYGIMQAAETLSNGVVTLGPGTLYSLIKRFERDGLVRECAPDAERRRCYCLTRKGRTHALAEVDRLAALVRVGKRRLLPSES